ncbi:hypothetical protein Y1Q_0009699 [Alligator mississippiensis]|uniref:Uncharacterized protein n=1 Tax=Alligator mississippiensis TaxID=8496 RepID=A0A151MWB2_ALLMI|nr:hypothetical protein Y1Q_0009699 [Alligator mississippiensis]
MQAVRTCTVHQDEDTELQCEAEDDENPAGHSEDRKDMGVLQLHSVCIIQGPHYRQFLYQQMDLGVHLSCLTLFMHSTANLAFFQDKRHAVALLFSSLGRVSLSGQPGSACNLFPPSSSMWLFIQ